MRENIGRVLLDAVKVAVAAWGVVWLEPAVEEALPKVPVFLIYVLLALIAAVAVELLVQLVIGRPRLRVEWSTKVDAAPISALNPRVSKRVLTSQVFVVRVSTPRTGWLGYLIMRKLMQSGRTLKVRIEQANATPGVENSTLTGGFPAVTANPTTRGIDIALGAAPRRPGNWHYAEVTWESPDGQPTDIEVNVDTDLHHDIAVKAWLLNMLVGRPTNVRRFQLVGR